MSNRRFAIPDPNAPKAISSPMQKAAAAVIEALPKDWSFALLAFPPDKPLNYVSNGNREDVLWLMKEFVAKSDAGLVGPPNPPPPDPPIGN